MKWKKFTREYVKLFVILMTVGLGVLLVGLELDESIRKSGFGLLLIILLAVIILAVPLTLAKIRG